MITYEDLSCKNCPEGGQHFFNKMSAEDLDFIDTRKEIHAFKKGQVVFHEGQKPAGIFCLQQGKIKIYKNCYDGREHITRIAFPAEFMGLKALLSGNPYSVSAAAMEDSVICFIRKADFFQLSLKYPAFAQSLIVNLSKLLEEAETRMVSLTHKPVRQRLAETLLFLNRSFHPTAPAWPKTYLNVTRMDLASIIGTTPETVIRLLSEFREAGMIRIKGRKIFLLDIHRLRLISTIKD